MPGDADNGHARRKDIFHDDGTGADPDIVRNADATENLGVLADVHMVADDGGVVRIAAVTADAAVAVDDAALADACLGIHDHGTETPRADDETQPGSEAVLAPAIPEAEQPVAAGELFLFPKETKIPLDVVHLRADPPLHEFFLERHDCAVNLRAHQYPVP